MDSAELGDSGKAATLIFEALGAASMCWDNPGGAGEFLSRRASEIGHKLMRDLGYELPEGYTFDVDTTDVRLETRSAEYPSPFTTQGYVGPCFDLGPLPPEAGEQEGHDA